jgi:hypothetical protein
VPEKSEGDAMSAMIDHLKNLYCPELANATEALRKPASEKQVVYIYRLLRNKSKSGITGDDLRAFFGVDDLIKITNGQAMYIIKFLRGEIRIPIPVYCACGCDHIEESYILGETWHVETRDCHCGGGCSIQRKVIL